jgi:hypothetical protein
VTTDGVDGTENRRPSAGNRPELNYRSVAQLTAAVTICVGSISRHLPPRQVVILLVSILVGGFLWKIPPFEVGPRPGTHNGFLLATAKRAWSAAEQTAKWGGVGAVFGVFVGAASAALTMSEHVGDHAGYRAHVGDHAGYGATWGTLIAGAIGAIVWTGTRVYQDAVVLKERQSGVARQSRPR